jgi:sodium transport system ATP-binding protein
MIQVQNLSKVFYDHNKEIKAINNLDFTCESGQVFGLLGPNGAGKTTTLRIIASIMKATSGKVIVDNSSVTENAEKVRKKIGFLTGTTGLYHYLTPREILTFFGKLFDMGPFVLKQRIEYLAQLFQMGDFLDRKIDNLSTGMKQKVSLSRTIIHDPPILILDEPMSGLDIISAKAIMDFIKQSREEGKCILFSTHVMREAELLCDRITIIHKGNKICNGTLDELRKKSGYQNLEDIFFHQIGA